MMNFTPTFHALMQEYCTERKLDVSAEQFAALVYTFPSALVAVADGVIDADEYRYMRFVPDELISDEEDNQAAKGDSKVQLHAQYYVEIEHLVTNRDKWENRFLTLLSDELAQSPDERNHLFKTMWRMADSSQDISEAERAKIEEIVKVLKL